MNNVLQEDYSSLDLNSSIWDQIFTVAPLVLIGTKEGKAYNLAPKHMITPLGFGNYFGFVCTAEHATYHNIKETRKFTVSFPTFDQLITTSLSASRRKEEISKYEGVLKVLPTMPGTCVDAPLLEGAYLYLECELFKIIEGFDSNSLITGKVLCAHGHKDFLHQFEKDEQDQFIQSPLLAYISPGRFARITETYKFPFPKGFRR
ncbi:flavin reductase family protein [Poritiphilus flavus]|uniref:Flavin reductase n=1 Tax=Poritiphilus flavus TaxID=2697053 RepID=A0A6L9EID1_9FLAO|nr:flavin reductase [Poritiphilus flavus]NAS14453.1 flavin reductase [Poritiphilus flavus]